MRHIELFCFHWSQSASSHIVERLASSPPSPTVSPIAHSVMYARPLRISLARQGVVFSFVCQYPHARMFISQSQSSSRISSPLVVVWQSLLWRDLSHGRAHNRSQSLSLADPCSSSASIEVLSVVLFPGQPCGLCMASSRAVIQFSGVSRCSASPGRS